MLQAEPSPRDNMIFISLVNTLAGRTDTRLTRWDAMLLEASRNSLAMYLPNRALNTRKAEAVLPRLGEANMLSPY